MYLLDTIICMDEPTIEFKINERCTRAIHSAVCYTLNRWAGEGDMDQEQLKIMMEKSKRQSVPQIFIGDYHIGGFDDLVEHDMDGKLEDLLKD